MEYLYSVLASSVFAVVTCLPTATAKSSGFDIDKFEEKLGGYIPTSTSVALTILAVLVALKIKKVLLLIGLLVLSKLLSGVWSFMGHKCPYKPVYIKEDEFYLQDEPHYHHHRSFEQDPLSALLLQAASRWR